MSHESKTQVIPILPSSHGDKQTTDENSSVTSDVHDNKRKSHGEQGTTRIAGSAPFHHSYTHVGT